MLALSEQQLCEWTYWSPPLASKSYFINHTQTEPRTLRYSFYNGDAFIIEGFLSNSQWNYPYGSSQGYQMTVSLDVQITEWIDGAPYIKEALEESVNRYKKEERVNFSHGNYRCTA